jgi:uncharacterized RDD family membrane protein YckC
MDRQIPSLVRRYGASMIDGFFMIFLMVLAAVALQAETEVSVEIRIVAFVLILFAYEPVLTSRLCTIGQRLTGLRVRRYGNPEERIGLLAAYVRFAVKILLGALSFLTLAFTKEKRAIHDLAAGSIMLQVTE